MGSAGFRVIELLKSRVAWAAIGVTVLTLVLIAGILTVTTTVACGPANGMGVKIAHCSDAKGTSAHLAPNPPTPSYYPAKGNQPPPVYNPPPPYRDPASNYPPYTNPASSDPPKDTSGSRYPPFPNTASGNPPADPFFPPASAGFTPPQTQSCSLPMYAGPPGSGGFVVFPQGNFVADPRSAVALPAPNAGAPSPAPNYPTGGGPGPGYGQGYSGYGMAWDPTHKRWLPVKPEMVAPDGNHYAYPSTNSIYLVDAATNSQVELGAGHPWTVLRVLNDRIYATVPNSPGLWVVPFTGTPRQASGQGYWQGATANAAYGTLTSAVPQGATSKIVRLDVASGALTDWFTREAFNSSVYGFDAQGNPIIYASASNGWNLWLTKSPTSASVITNSYGPIWPAGTPFADSKGIWFPGYFNQSGQNGQGVGLYIAGSGFYWMAFVGGQLAGGCA